jgi:peptide deformylase
MLLKIGDMPDGIKLCKVLTYDKISSKCSFIDKFPKPGELIINTDQSKSLVNEALMNACWRMVKACLNDDGVGLAAPQIGIMKRLFIIRHDAEHFKVYFHPKFTTDINSKVEFATEGCLSVPGKKLSIPRQTMIMAEWVEIDPENRFVSRAEILEGWPARIFQHEYDHIEGISIVDRARAAKTL